MPFDLWRLPSRQVDAEANLVTAVGAPLAAA
jgi:hypothetical protein